MQCYVLSAHRAFTLVVNSFVAAPEKERMWNFFDICVALIAIVDVAVFRMGLDEPWQQGRSAIRCGFPRFPLLPPFMSLLLVVVFFQQSFPGHSGSHGFVWHLAPSHLPPDTIGSGDLP